MKKEFFEDKRISWAAKGVMSYFLSKPDGWVLHVYDLQNKNSRGVKGLQSTVKELIKYGYIKRITIKDHDKFVGSGYILGDWYYEFLIYTKNKRPANDEYYSIEWQKKRLEILDRDKWTCKECGCDSGILHVHHLRYNNGRPVWDIDNKYLITLCHKCHKNKHS
jgi:hypothetical protein